MTRRPGEITREEAEQLHQAIQATKIMAPPIDCIAPIGEELIERALRAEVKADFYAAISRRASVYRGNPFLIEVGLAYGGSLPAEEPVTRLPLREPRSAPVPAGRLRDHQGRRLDGLEGLRAPASEGRAAGRRRC